jgi:hypothetical protein
MNNLGNGIDYLLNNKKNILSLGLYTAGIYGSYYLSKRSIGLGMNIIESKIRKPSLIKETSRITIDNFHYQILHKLLETHKRIKQKKSSELFEGFICEDALKKELKVFSDGILMRK